MHSLKFKAKSMDNTKSCRVVVGNNRNRFISIIASYVCLSLSLCQVSLHSFIEYLRNQVLYEQIMMMPDFVSVIFLASLRFGHIIPSVSVVSSSSSNSNI